MIQAAMDRKQQPYTKASPEENIAFMYTIIQTVKMMRVQNYLLRQPK